MARCKAWTTGASGAVAGAACQILHRLHLQGHPEPLGHLGADGLDPRLHLLQVDLRQHPAVQVKDVPPGNGVDVADVFLFAGGLEGALRRPEERILPGKFPRQLVQGHDDVGAGPQGIAARLRPGGVGLLAQERQAQPEDALLRHLDHGAVLAAGVGHDDQVFCGKKPAVFPHQVFQAQMAAGLFVGDQGQGHGALRGQPQVQEGLDRHQGRDDAVVVVLHAPAVKAVAFHPQVEGVGMPQGNIARRHHVQVAQDPDLVRPPPRQVCHQVGALPFRRLDIRGRVIVHLQAPALQ